MKNFDFKKNGIEALSSDEKKRPTEVGFGLLAGGYTDQKIFLEIMKNH